MLAVLVMELILRFSATETEADPFRIAGVPLSPSRASETDDQHAKRVGQNTIRVIRPAAEMQKEDKMNADLRQGKHDQSDRRTGGPQQIGLRHDKRRNRCHDRKPQTHGVRQDIGRPLVLLDTRCPVLMQAIVAVHRWTPIR
jgi:hypothetical protein